MCIFGKFKVSTGKIQMSHLEGVTLCVGKLKFPLFLQDSHPNLYSTKTYSVFLIHSGSVHKMLTALFKLV